MRRCSLDARSPPPTLCRGRLTVPGPAETQSSPVHRPQAADHHHVPRVPHRHRLLCARHGTCANSSAKRSHVISGEKNEGTVIGDRLAADTAPANAADESVRPSGLAPKPATSYAAISLPPHPTERSRRAAALGN